MRERPGRVLATVTAAQVLSVASATVVAVALPSIARDLDASPSEQQWVIDAFVLVFASLLVAGGVLGDRRGRRRVLLAGLGVFATASLVCAVAPGVGWLLGGRVLMGLGPPLVLPASLAIVVAAYPEPAARARAIGLWGAGSGTGVALGPLLGGAIVDTLGWRWVFGVNVPICLLLALLAWRFVPRDRPARPEHPFDLPAAALLTGGVAALVFALIEGRGLGWTSAPVLGSAAAAVVLLAALVRRERVHPAPLVDLALLRGRTFVAANLGAAALFGAFTALAVYFSVFFQQVQDRSALAAGLCLLPQGALVALCAPFAGRLTARIGARTPMLAGMACATTGVLVLLPIAPSSSIAALAGGLALTGMGLGLALPAMTVTALATAPPERTGMASALHNASRQLGQTFGVAVLGTVLLARAGDVPRGRLSGAAALDFVAGLHLALAVAAAGLAVAGLAVAVLLPARLRRAPDGKG